MPRKSKDKLPRLYHDLSTWFHLLTSPADYREEADFYRELFQENCRPEPRTLLELGSGGGNNASHLKAFFKLTLTDLSGDMLAISRRLNPECEHIRGDMRTLRLRRKFDAVMAHDAISYITTRSDLAKAIKTAFIHCRPGGAALFIPDYVRETFFPATGHGGHDGNGRAMRYLEWIRDPDPDDTTYIMDFAYLLKEGDKVTCESERHVMGLFREDDWLDAMKKAGFYARIIERRPNWSPPMGTRVFLGVRPEK
jgi:ubiquinone/menaquinone biosynthesis C-methylase UbiE